MNFNGAVAERKAASYLRKKKYKLLGYNYKTRFGEIDLIFQDGQYVVFVEVKARGENSIASPAEFVDYKKQKNIVSSALLYLSSNKIKLTPRFDVIEVFYEKGKIKTIKHLENAFTLD